MFEKKTLSIEFDNDEALHHFAIWLSEQGEQDYWQWMEYREDVEDGDITAIKFNYHAGRRHPVDATFLSDNTIRTTAGRMDKDWK